LAAGAGVVGEAAAQERRGGFLALGLRARAVVSLEGKEKWSLGGVATERREVEGEEGEAAAMVTAATPVGTGEGELFRIRRGLQRLALKSRPNTYLTVI
jgi:hypothetical protein